MEENGENSKIGLAEHYIGRADARRHYKKSKAVPQLEISAAACAVSSFLYCPSFFAFGSGIKRAISSPKEYLHDNGNQRRCSESYHDDE
ncbi:MAG: hypothetical protein LBU76_08145 [Azoarcus sp.]|jgi:hypothetical protein|nr:hypothetical protein [Azoarcus sp.]